RLAGTNAPRSRGKLAAAPEAGVRLRVRSKRAAGPLDLDALRLQERDECAGASALAVEQQDVGPVATDVTVERRVVAEQCTLAGGGGPQRRLAGRAVLLRALAQGEHGAVRALIRQARPAAAGLLVRHADRAQQRWPAVAVAGIEQVVRLAREVGPAVHVERRRVRGAEALTPREHVRRVVRVDRLRRREEEVRRLRA